MLLRVPGVVLSGVLLVVTSAQAAQLACPPSTDPAAVEAWRNAAIETILAGDVTPLSSLDSCFTETPACVQRVRDYYDRQTVIDSGSTDTQAKDDPRKQPPRELLSNVGENFDFELRGDFERVAKERGWPVVRYKSRFSGGFDPGTPSLIMVRVPGDKVNPPVDYDRYLNIPLPADPAGEELNPVPTVPMVTPEEFRDPALSGLPGTFTIVTVQRKSGEASKVIFQMYNRGSTGDAGKWGPRSTTSVQGCYGCHVNGVREISPLGYHVRAGERQMPPEMWKAVKEMNDSMSLVNGFAPNDWRGIADPETGKFRKYLVPAGYGPIKGPLVPLTRERIEVNGNMVIKYPTRTKEFILGANGQPGCAQQRTTIPVTDIFGRPPGRNNIYTFTQDPAVRWEKVRDAMNCASCHNNKQRGALNEGTSWSEIDFKILVDQSMPWGWHRNPMDRGSPSKAVVDLLNPNERIALANCLQAEWTLERAKLPDWFKESSCSPSN